MQEFEDSTYWEYVKVKFYDEIRMIVVEVVYLDVVLLALVFLFFCGRQGRIGIFLMLFMFM